MALDTNRKTASRRHQSLPWLLLAALLCGCSASFTIPPHRPSGIPHTATAPPTTVVLVDLRADTTFHRVDGRLKRVALSLELPAEPLTFLAAALEAEWRSRGLDVRCRTGRPHAGDLPVQVTTFRIESRQATFLSPWEVCVLFSATRAPPDTSMAVRAFAFGRKVPVVTIDEIAEPNYTRPLQSLVCEIATKIGRQRWNAQSSQGAIDSLLAAAGRDTTGPGSTDTLVHLLHRLGTTSNPAIAPLLERYARDRTRPSVRAAALSAIGTAHLTSLQPLLIEQARQLDDYSQFMAVKALGDLATPQSLAHVRAERNRPWYAEQPCLRHCVELYLEPRP